MADAKASAGSEPGSLLRQLNTWASLDLRRASVESIVSRINGLLSRQRRQGLFLAERVLRTTAGRTTEDSRVAAVNVLVALLPDSRHSIREWLVRRSGDAYDVHFSLFCFLDQVSVHPRLHRCADEVLAMVESYLQGIESTAGQAAWMAGDLLGEHWEGPGALPVLIRTAASARFAAGRYGAIHGLGQMLASEATLADTKRLIRDSLRNIAKSDRSRRLRGVARQILHGQVV
jgi:hypothetical protein